MAYSEVKIYTLTRDDIINAALRKVGEYDDGDAASSGELSDAQQTLNNIISEWRGEGVGLWLRHQFILILNSGKQRYSLGPAGTSGTVDDFHAFLSTELNEATGTAVEPLTTTSIAVDAWVDYAGNDGAVPSVGDYVGIRLADGTMFWDTVAAGSNATTVVLTNGVTTATEIGSKVYTYTTRVPRPYSILTAHRTDTSGNTAEVDIIGRTEYERLSLKSSDGDPVKASFDPQLAVSDPDNDFAWLHVWPVKNSKSLDKLVILGEFYPDVFVTNTDNPHFPKEWANALIWNLAFELCFDYEVSRELRIDVSIIAKAKKERILELSDLENADVRFARDAV